MFCASTVRFFYLGQTSSVWTRTAFFGLSLPATLVSIRGRRFLRRRKTYSYAKWETCLGGLGQDPARCCVTDAHLDSHDCIVPGGRLYLNTGKMSKAICGPPVNGRLVSREKSPQGEGCRNSCDGSSTRRMYTGGGVTQEGCAVSHGNCLVEIASSLLSCRHRYLLTPTHTLMLMQMRPVPMKNWWICRFIPSTPGMCVREHARDTTRTLYPTLRLDRWESNLSDEGVSYDNLTFFLFFFFMWAHSQRRHRFTEWFQKTDHDSKPLHPSEQIVGNDSQWGLIFSSQPTSSSCYSRFLFFPLPQGVW